MPSENPENKERTSVGCSIPSFINVTPWDSRFLSVRMDNEDVGGAGESIPLILTYFMIMKGIQRMIMIKVGSPTDVPALLCS